MNPLSTFRCYLHDLRKRITRGNRHSSPLIQGLPGDLHIEEINSICRIHYHDYVASSSFRHLSGWKSSGAYRVILRTEKGKIIRLIYKEAIYSDDHIPALVHFPIRPGPPEFAILSLAANQDSRQLFEFAPYLPKVFLAQELQSGHHYRYIMEDLAEEYRKSNNDEDVKRICKILPVVHDRLSRLSCSISCPDDLIQYGEAFSTALQTYAATNLERFSQKVDDPNVKMVLDQWGKITSLHLQPFFLSGQPLQLIHGDTNFTNIHLHKRNLGLLKLVDWEWSGYGKPLADLASLLKGTPANVEYRCFDAYYQSFRFSSIHSKDRQLSLDEALKLYRWSKMERGLIDASFLAAQYLDTNYTAMFSLPTAVSKALKRVLLSYEQLSS